ncbi:hypothetical protein SGRA_3735 [Saprospira grandis str. Lewin]|uniref:Uncharacterized protein n=1 Tax=Saprospira grandis (strain Lewin) TaxID=984262 RepID=H6L887_SAPGL|nr:hypothetical protein SGRA_3735 [Saprospira grandis str. Lewin]
MGPAAGKPAAAMLRGSQGCSALRFFALLKSSVWPSATPPQRWAAHRGVFTLGLLLWPLNQSG